MSTSIIVSQTTNVPLLRQPSNSLKDQLLSTVTPIPLLLESVVDIDNCTYVTIKDNNLMSTISKFVGNLSNQSFVITPKQSNDSVSFDDEENEKSEKRTEISMGIGWHEIKFEENIIKILYQMMGQPVGTQSGARVYESIVLLVEGKGNYAPIQKFCDHVIAFYEKTEENTFNVYQYNVDYNYWSVISTKDARPLDSVILPPDVKHNFIKDIDDFLSPGTYRWYRDHGIPYKRSYLLYGPPGSGKSSIIQAIAGKYSRNLCFVQPLKPNFTDDSFTTCVQKAPNKALIVLEDIDAFFGKDRETLHKSCPLTFSGLLNGLDGVGSTDGQIFILTTNFIDRLDEALIRSGRVDKRIEFPAVNPDSAHDMFLQFYPKEEDDALLFKKGLANLISENSSLKLCMADLQQHFISHRKNKANIASTDFTDITGEEYKLINELADKKIKDTEKKEEEEKEEEKNDTISRNNSFVPYNIFVGLGLGVSLYILTSTFAIILKKN